jgi:coatomer subunit beta'
MPFALRLNYYVGGEIVTIAHLEKNLYMLGYVPAHNRLYLADKECQIYRYRALGWGAHILSLTHAGCSYYLNLHVLEYQTAVLRGDEAAANTILPQVPISQRTRVAQFLEKQGGSTTCTRCGHCV